MGHIKVGVETVKSDGLWEERGWEGRWEAQREIQ